MADFSGKYIDPRGFEITLRAPNALEFRQLVTKKLAQGWTQVGGPVVAPLSHETTLAIGAAPAPAQARVAEVPSPTPEEREAAFADAIAEATAEPAAE